MESIIKEVVNMKVHLVMMMDATKNAIQMLNTVPKIQKDFMVVIKLNIE